MSNRSEPRDVARKKAQNHFAQAEQRDTFVRQELEKERSTREAKTAKLRALRLAREAAETVEAARIAALPPSAGKSGAVKKAAGTKAILPKTAAAPLKKRRIKV